MGVAGSERQVSQHQQLMMLQQQNPLPQQPQQVQGLQQQQQQQQPGGIRPYLKTPEGVYLLSHEKHHPSGLIQYTHQRNPTKITLAALEDKSNRAQAPELLPAGSSTPSPGTANPSSASGTTPSSGNRFYTRGLLGSGAGSRGLGFGIGNGRAAANRGQTPGQASAPGIAVPAVNSAAGQAVGNGPVGGAAGGGGEAEVDSATPYVVFNIGETLFIADYNTVEKEPIKSLHFAGSQGLHHAFDPTSREGHDLAIATFTGEVFTASLRQQLQDNGRKLVNATVYNKDSCVTQSKCTSVAWIPNSEGQFVTAHVDGNLFVYDKGREGTGEVSFPPLRDPQTFSVDRRSRNKSNPVERWHVCAGAINAVCFSPGGSHCATVGRDGYLRVLDWEKQILECGCRSYYGALLCCAFSDDAKMVAAGGEDDMVLLWDREEQSVVGWCEGHSSWVSDVAFDAYWSPPPTEDSSQNSNTYRFASVAQDAKLLVWEVSMDELTVVPASRSISTTSSAAPHFQDQLQSINEGVAYLPQQKQQQLQHSPSQQAAGHHPPKEQQQAQQQGGQQGGAASQAQPQAQAQPQQTSRSFLGQLAPGNLQPRTLFQSGARPLDSTGGGSGGAAAASAGNPGAVDASPSFQPPPEASGAPAEASGATGRMFPSLFHSSVAQGGVLQEPPSRNVVARISPILAHKVHAEPLSSVAFSKAYLFTACQEGIVKLWLRPGGSPLAGSLASQESLASVSKSKGKQVNANTQRH